MDDLSLLQAELEARCKIANITHEKIQRLDLINYFSRVYLNCGREKRAVSCFERDEYEALLNMSFEKYVFLSGFDAICSYSEGKIEALVRPVGRETIPFSMFSRLFGIPRTSLEKEWRNARIDLYSDKDGVETSIYLSPVSNEFEFLVGLYMGGYSLSLKIYRNGLTNHDQATSLLRQVANSLFFQIDLLFDIPLLLSRERQLILSTNPDKSAESEKLALEYPRSEYDAAPMSLYWYARSALGMPLLQFLAYYQVIEFYYPTYSQIEARRKLQAILKDPTFRPDRDVDISRALSSIQITRNGAYGDERSQLKATLTECVEQTGLLKFLRDNQDRAKFLSSKTKGLTDQKLSLEGSEIDLRNDVAERIYDIRCRIVHTKIDAKTGGLDLLLPFSKEAEQLHFDIELIQYLAQKVLISASRTFQA